MGHTWRVRFTEPPRRLQPHEGHEARAWLTRCVEEQRFRAKPFACFLRGCPSARGGRLELADDQQQVLLAVLIKEGSHRLSS